MNTKQKLKKTALVKAVRRDDPYLTLGAARVESDKFWRWGDDNLFPAALALMARRSTTHRRIINDKADYISGKGVVCDANILTGVVKVRLDKSPDSPPVVMDRKDVKVIRDGKLKVGKEERANLSNLEE